METNHNCHKKKTFHQVLYKMELFHSTDWFLKTSTNETVFEKECRLKIAMICTWRGIALNY